jgi:asparagine synthase (glutamine-hydrolysing)
MESDYPINTYTIGFPELNEFEYARLVAKRFETKHHEIVMNENDYLELMGEIIEFKDSPLGVPNEIPLAQMSKELKKNITVVLSGEGADELLGGDMVGFLGQLLITKT